MLTENSDSYGTNLDLIAEFERVKCLEACGAHNAKITREGHPLVATLALGYIDESEFRAIATKHHPEIDVEGWCDAIRDD